MKIPKGWLIWCFNTFDYGEEFDSEMVRRLLSENFGTEFSVRQVSKTISTYDLQKRRLTRRERLDWLKEHDSEPSTVYTRHLGNDPEQYPRGYARPTQKPNQQYETDIEECAFCPEWQECQGQIVPCPRYPDQKNADRTRVMRLEDFE